MASVLASHCVAPSCAVSGASPLGPDTRPHSVSQCRIRSTPADPRASGLASSRSWLASRQLQSRSSTIPSRRLSKLCGQARATLDDSASESGQSAGFPASTSAAATRRDLLATTAAISAAFLAQPLLPGIANADEAVSGIETSVIVGEATTATPTEPARAATVAAAPAAPEAAPAATLDAGSPAATTPSSSSNSSPTTPTQPSAQPSAQPSPQASAQPSAQPSPQPSAQQPASRRPASEVLDVASWQRVRGEDFAVRLPPGFVDVTPQPDEEALDAPMSTVGLENRAKKSPLLARFVSADESEVITVIYRRAADVKLSFFEPKDVSDFGPIEEVANLFVPPGSRVLAKRAFTATPRRATRTYYLYEFVTGKGPKALHGAMSVSVARGQVYLMAATAPEEKWRPAAARLRAAAGAFLLVI